MIKAVPKTTAGSLAAVAIALLSGTAAPLAAADLPPPGSDDLAFSVENMDPSADPGADFLRYASGAWLDRVERPERLASYGIFDIVGERLKARMKIILTQAGAAAETAPGGSPAQQVGAIHAAYMDVAARDAAGVTPLRPQLDEIAAIESLDDFTRLMGALAHTDGPLLLAAFGPMDDLADSARYAIYGAAGQFGMPADDVYDDAPDSPRIAAYRTYLAQILEVAGYAPAEAGRIADLAISIETELHAAKLPPVEAADPRKIYNPLTFAEVQAQIPELDLGLYFEEMGYPQPDRIILTEPRYLPVLSNLLRERPLQDFKDYAALMLILKYQGVLTTAFEEPTRELSEALTGVPVLLPREERALALITSKLGHPVSQLYVDAAFTDEQRAKAVDMIARIRETFAARIPARDWLSEQTRIAALEKLDAFTIRVGYPENWIDYSGVEIGGDLVADLVAIARFENDRMRAKFDGPVDRDAFSNPRATLPIVVNAAYNPLLNGFEIPAAILQPPMFQAEMDAPVYFCRLGAIIGHEMTHGFDSNGRQYDAEGNLRDWWTAEDALAFEAEAQKLVDQANAFEVLPGLSGNGALEVTENMADVGGVTLASEALRRYLADHPEEDVAIDGLSPLQRCFISWAQMWTSKTTDQLLRTQVATDPHPASSYRAVAPLLDAFHEAFGIGEGDPMWLPPESRVDAW
jgi:putative endopeptidase